MTESGCLDVTQAPYLADPMGTSDSTSAIQRAVDDARDRKLACFFPSGVYLVTETISCEQPVRKLDTPRHTDDKTQSYWDITGHPCVLLGSTKGPRPVIKLADAAQGFDNPSAPMPVVYIWAQTRNDAPGKGEPIWGEEQPNISFNHIFRGIDLDIRGHAGAIGVRHTGSQGSSLQDVCIEAEGAFAGLGNCPGQGGGTYNVEVVGGRHGMVAGPECRFPILVGCQFHGQTAACVAYASRQLPMLLAGCRLQSSGDHIVDLAGSHSFIGLSIVDSILELGMAGSIVASETAENVFLENVTVRGADRVVSVQSREIDPTPWIRFDRYSACAGEAQHCINGSLSRDTIRESSSVDSPPTFESLSAQHWSRTPSFEDDDAVSLKSFGAVGDGVADDTEAIQRALDSARKIFAPKGDYRTSAPLQLGNDTVLFGLSGVFSSIGPERRRGGPTVRVASTPDDPEATTHLSFLSLNGEIDWRAGKGVYLLTRSRLGIHGGGGRFYGVMAMGRQLVIENTDQPVALYAHNVERVRDNPQSVIRNASNVTIHYLKGEATVRGYGTVNGRGVAVGTGNTVLSIQSASAIRVYCATGNVMTGEGRPMIEVIDSKDVLISQAKSFKTGSFSQVRETYEGESAEIPSGRVAALVVRE